jgi:hypothetical protein
MRFSTTLPALLAAAPLATALDFETPFGSFQKILGQAQAFLPKLPTASIVQKNVVNLDLENQKTTFQQASTKRSVVGKNKEIVSEGGEWWVYVTGANKTCYGQCGITDKAWNVSTESF